MSRDAGNAFGAPPGPEEDGCSRLKQSEWRFRSLIESAPMAVLILTSDGAVKYASAAVEDLLGYEPGATLGLQIFHAVHPEDQHHFASLWANTASEYGAAWRMQLRFRHKTGSWRTLECAGRNLLHNPVVGGVVVYAFDVTEQAEVRYRVRQSATDAYRRNSDLLKAIGGLEGNGSLKRALECVAGEFVAPLRELEQLAFLLLSTRLDSNQRECVQAMLDFCRILGGTVRSLESPAAASQ